MIDPHVLYPFVIEGARAMVFVDGENLAMCYGDTLGGVPPPSAMSGWCKPDVAVWAKALNPPSAFLSGTRVVRRYYFTSEQGTDDKRAETTDWLKSRGFELPRVFRRDKERGSNGT
jgi:hypothetical protein